MATLNDSMSKYFERASISRFEDGRTFRSFKELNIAGSATYVVKIVVPVPVLFTGFEVATVSGSLKVETVAAGTPGGTFSETLPIFKSNLTKVTPYVGKAVLTAGGTHTGGTVIDVIRIKADGNQTRASNVIQRDAELRGIAPGTYHWRFINLDTTAVVGTVKILWEELPA